jgi:hypothetical protein
MSYPPESYKVRSGPGVSVFGLQQLKNNKKQITHTKWFDKLTTSPP